MSIVVQDGLVRQVTPWSDRDGNRGYEVVDLSDATVTPGLLDAHTHLCHGAVKSPAWAGLADDPTAIVAWGLASCAAALAAGITTVVDCGSPSGLALTVRNLVAAGVANGPQVLAAGEAITTTGGHGEFLGTRADNADDMRRAVRGLVGRGADLIKIMATGGATDPHTNRRRAQYNTEQLRAAVTDAHRLGRLVVGHANATEGITRCVAAGIDVVAHCNWLGPEPGTVALDMPTVDAMTADGTYVDLNLQGARRPLAETDGAPTDWPHGTPPPLCRWDLFAPMRRAGVAIYLSSDAFGPAIGSYPADLGCAVAEWRVPVEDLVHRTTALPAQAFGLDDRGLIERRRRADLVAFDGDLRADPSGLGRPVAVWRGGHLAVDAGRISLPAVAHRHDAEAQAQLREIDEVFHELG